MTEVHPYLNAHFALIKRQNPYKREAWLISEHNRSFAHWFKEKVMNDLSNKTHNVFNMSANDAGNSSEKKKTRGVTTGQSLTSEELEKLHIEFDDLGQPTGFYKSKFATDMGVLVRNIKITYQSWKKNTWKLDDDKQKIILKILSGALKEFRSRLTRTYITKTLKPKEGEIIGDSPVGKYKAITNEIWEEFKKQRMDKRFLVISAKARASQRMNLHPHYLGRAGYTGKKEKWYKEELAQALTGEQLDNHDSDPTLSQESVTLVDERFSDRGYLWIKAHTPPSTCRPPPRIQDVTEKFWVWKEKEQKGEFIPTRFEDALTKALGKPEHNGRTRGVGRHVGLQTYFGRPTSRGSNGKIYTEDDMRLLMEKVKSETKEEVKREAMEEMNAMMEKKWAEFMGKTASVNQNVVASAEYSLSHRQEESSSHSTHYTDPFVKLKESVHCRLAVYMNGELIIVAEGMVSPWVKGKTVHNKPLSMENAHVSIDSVIRADAPLPLPWNGFTNVGEAEGSFSQWPKSLILMGNEVMWVEQIKGKDIAQGEEQDIRPLNVIEVDGLDHYCQALEKKLCSFPKDEVIKMVIDESVYNYKEGNTVSYLTIVEIRQMFRNQWLNVVVLQIWGSFLYQCATEIEAANVVGFMCPVKLLDYMHNTRQCEDYIMHVMKIQEGKKYIMGAFYEGNHWMLIVICLELNTMYILDSQQRTQKKLSIKGRLKAAWLLRCVNGGRRNFAKKNNQLQIKVIECPQQPEHYECGYYVMKWMYNITFYYSKGNEEQFEKIIGDSTMSLEDMNEVKEVWATKCLENM
ncbi:hypothetical protein KSS87_021786 [Heliosperma pusillum]|nr:hypothetical protein KSS87_021786 [Heliosperma pusillum]